MRFWITKNGELSIREQIVTQVRLGILSQDLTPGQRLPSVRGLARRHRIHPNTVSGSYRELVEGGWLELRRGSGLFVCPPVSSIGAEAEIDRLLGTMLKRAASLGYNSQDVLLRLQHQLGPHAATSILIAEPDPSMREILMTEISERVNVPVRAISPGSLACENAVVVALPSRVQLVQKWLPPATACMPLRLQSINSALMRQAYPNVETLVSIVSCAAEIRREARAMLIAVGLNPKRLCDVDASLMGWQDRLGVNNVAVCDVVTSRLMSDRCDVRTFRVIAESSILELQRMTQ